MEVLEFVKKLATDLTEIDGGSYKNRAFLAGGAARDIDHQKQPKDYDIFVLANDIPDEDVFLDSFEERYGYLNEDLGGNYRDLRNAIVTNVHNFEGQQGQKIQVVFYKPEAIYDTVLMNFGTVVSAFDLNICKIGVHQENDKFKILKTNGYKRDVENKTITNTPEYKDVANIKLRRRVANRAKNQANKLGYGVDVQFLQGNENVFQDRPILDLGPWAQFNAQVLEPGAIFHRQEAVRINNYQWNIVV